MPVQVLLIGLERFSKGADLDLSPGIVCQASDSDGDGGLDYMEIFFPKEFLHSPPGLLHAIQEAFWKFLRARYGVLESGVRIHVGAFDDARLNFTQAADRALRSGGDRDVHTLSLYHILGPQRMRGFPRCLGGARWSTGEDEVPTLCGDRDKEKAPPADETPVRCVVFSSAKKKVPVLPSDIPGKVIAPELFVPLVVDDAERLKLQRIFTALRLWEKLQDAWGMGALTGGAGPTALFYGPSGTGKTQAARRIASEMGKPLLVVNHQEVLNKYIGDTEKAIEKVFWAAEEEGLILLFDEADSFLFSRANAEHPWEVTAVNAVLQRMERTRTVILFTTNLEGRLDPAVDRRLLFKVRFPPPTRSARKAIWTVLVPERAPKADIDFEALAVPELTGGEIKNAILSACIEAASREGVLTTQSLLECALEAASSHLNDSFEEERMRGPRPIGFQAPIP